MEDAAPAAVVEDVADVTVHAEAEQRGRRSAISSSSYRHGALKSEEWGVRERGREWG